MQPPLTPMEVHQRLTHDDLPEIPRFTENGFTYEWDDPPLGVELAPQATHDKSGVLFHSSNEFDTPVTDDTTWAGGSITHEHL